MTRPSSFPVRSPAIEQGGRSPFDLNGPGWVLGNVACWDALVRDTGALVAVVDEAGRFHFVNEALASVLGLVGSHAALGRTIHELLPKPFADERLSFIRQVAASETPVSIDGLWAGRWVRSTVRPLTAGDDGLRRVLLVAVPVAASAQADGQNHAVRASIDDLGPLNNLTKREMDVLRLIGQGLSTADIARHLFRSVKTIEGHRVSLGNKLKVSNRVELARIAIRAGLVTLDETPDAVPDEDSPN